MCVRRFEECLTSEWGRKRRRSAVTQPRRRPPMKSPACPPACLRPALDKRRYCQRGGGGLFRVPRATPPTTRREQLRDTWLSKQGPARVRVMTAQPAALSEEVMYTGHIEGYYSTTSTCLHTQGQSELLVCRMYLCAGLNINNH